MGRDCKQCGATYDLKELQIRLRAPYPWTHDYCSAGCKAKRELIEEVVARRNESILSCYKCGATDKLCMIPCNSERGLTGFIFVCMACESSVMNKRVDLTLTDKEA